jgi:hypothetical protein
MKYQCVNGHLFLHVAKQVHFLEAKDINIDEDTTTKVMDTIEASCCPYCYSKLISEIEVVEPVANVESVYIYELTSGPQLGLDKLLADGYVIVNRYAKTYSLEKVKVVIPKGEIIEEIIEKVKESKKVEQPDPDDNQVFTDDQFTKDAYAFYAKLHPQNTEATKQ